MRPLVPLAAVLAALLLAPAAGTATGYVEDFEDDAAKDPATTTADWNVTAGELRFFPFAPAGLGSADTPDRAVACAVAGNLACVADELSGLRVFDVTSPSAPVFRGSLDTPGEARGVALAGLV
ncbi:MAG: hypothetical protein ACRDGR_03405, partial [bacterium]